MTTNVYMTNTTNSTLGLGLVFSGPDPDFQSGFHQLQSSVGAKAPVTQVLAIDRDGSWGDKTTVAELRITNGSTFIAALEIAMTASFDPLQLINIIYWSWRTAGPTAMPFTSDRNPHGGSVTVGGHMYQFSFQAVAKFGLFDDLYVTVTSVTKVVVSNSGALKGKYGAGVTKIEAAVAQLVAADQKAGTLSTLIYLDDTATMQALGAPPVTQSNNEQQVKAAIDGVFAAVSPLQMTILGAPDVVPHQTLINPVINDDPTVPSDLPYTSAAPYSTKISDFLAPSRVVSRLPDLTGGTDPAYPVKVITNATVRTTGTVAQYQAYWAVSCDVWKGSTTSSVTNVYGNANAMALSPPSGPNWTAAQMRAMSFFVNLHGNDHTSYFQGQTAKQYPIAVTSALLAGATSPNMVFTAECCFGAQLYNPALAADKVMGIANQVMLGGSCGFFGSSNVAWGPPNGQGQADIITQEFMKSVLAGKTVGQAALDARQVFIRTQNMASPTNLKTIGQFMLIGDTGFAPVVKPPAVPGEALEPSGAIMSAENERQATELQLVTDHSEPAPEHPVPDVVSQAIARIVEQREFTNYAVTPHRVVFNASRADLFADLDVHIYSVVETIENSELGRPTYESVEITATQNQILSIQESSSK